MRVFGRRKVRKASGFVVKVVAVTKDGIIAVSSTFPIDASNNTTNHRDFEGSAMPTLPTIRPSFSSGASVGSNYHQLEKPRATASPTPTLLRRPTTSGLSWQGAFGVASAIGAACGVFLVALGMAVASALKTRRESRSRQASDDENNTDDKDGSWNQRAIYV
jgi:uncharacterized membrane protein